MLASSNKNRYFQEIDIGRVGTPIPQENLGDFFICKSLRLSLRVLCWEDLHKRQLVIPLSEWS